MSVGTAMADYLDDLRYDISYANQQRSQSIDFSDLPATAADKMEESLAQKTGGVVDGPDNNF